MKLLRSTSPEVAHCIASGGVLACWGSVVAPACIATATGLLIGLSVSLIVSVRTAIWVGGPIVLALNGYVLWRGRSPRLNWVIVGCADRMFVRLFVRRRKSPADTQEPDVIMLEAPEIASMSIRTVEVFLHGPKPKIIEWLVIKPAQAVAEDVFSYIGLLLGALRPTMSCIGPIDPTKQVFVGTREGALTVEWNPCRPALQVFLQKVARECPAVVMVREERSELDLNGIWNGISLNLDSQKRQLLIQAKRLGFGSECRWLLCRYKYISLRKAAAYLAEIEREEAGAERSLVQQ